jgi:hypothetical protein
LSAAFDWNNNQTRWSLYNASSWCNNYHTYSFTWWPDHVDFWVDGNFTGTKWDTAGGGIGVHPVIDTAVGGNGSGNPIGSIWATGDNARYLKFSSVTCQPCYS